MAWTGADTAEVLYIVLALYAGYKLADKFIVKRKCKKNSKQ